MGKTGKNEVAILDKRVIPLGVRKENEYVTFSVSVSNAKECKLLLYFREAAVPNRIITLTNKECFGSVFIFKLIEKELIEDCYLYEVNGRTFVDPYATGITNKEVYGKVLGEEDKRFIRGTWSFDSYDWMEDKRLLYPYSSMIMYKLHVRGFTMHPNSSVKHKGTYLGLIEKIPYLKDLGITSLLLMPCVEYDEIMEDRGCFGMPTSITPSSKIDFVRDVSEKGKINYWGYSKAFYFAPKSSYAYEGSQAKDEFKKMVKEFHKAGIEILMEFYFDKGTPQLLILESLRYWVMEYHVDGFRLVNDITIAHMLALDPYLAQTKLIANYWNTEEIYDREFIPEYKNLAEYNTGFLYDIRRFLKGDEEQLYKFTEHFKRSNKKKGFINLICDNNGFTLADLYSYDRKHNEKNGENNKDGTDYNFSWNCGVEGVTKSKKIKELRVKMMKNALTVLLLSQGTPMLLAGDEFGNSQAGNNNVYCQDNEIGWVDWKAMKQKGNLLSFTKGLVGLKKEHKVLHSELLLREMDYISCGFPDISFHGTKAWCPEFINYCRTIGIMLCGYYAVSNHNDVDNFFYFAFNMHWEAHTFDMPDLPKGMVWVEEYNTSGILADCCQGIKEEKGIYLDEMITKSEKIRNQMELKPRSIAVFISKNIIEKNQMTKGRKH